MTFSSIKSTLLNQKKKKEEFNFEIFGYDFILDSSYNPWIIEINSNPCLEESSPFLSKILHRMIGIIKDQNFFFFLFLIIIKLILT